MEIRSLPIPFDEKFSDGWMDRQTSTDLLDVYHKVTHKGSRMQATKNKTALMLTRRLLSRVTLP